MRAKIMPLAALVLIAGLALPMKAQDKASRFEPAKVISSVEPVYPPNVVNPGTVVLEVTVGPSGEIENVKVARDAPGFTGEAQRVVRMWKFKAATLDGRPVRSVISIAFSFSQPPVTWPH
jgi:TonB family protein